MNEKEEGFNSLLSVNSFGSFWLMKSGVTLSFLFPNRAVGAKLCNFDGCSKSKYAAFDYCGRTHAEEALKKNGKQVKLPSGPCYKCKLDSCSAVVFYDQALGRVHDFCSFTHAQKYKALNPPNPNALNATSLPVCSLPGCITKVYVDESTEPHMDRVFKGDSWELGLLTRKHREYLPLAQYFTSNWLKTDSTPTVERIYKITPPTAVQEAYRSKSITNNRMKLFHGSKMSETCSFGIKLNKAPCTLDDCSMCQIAKHGFKLAKAGSNRYPINLRYGFGLYFSPCSGKSNDYVGKDENHSGKVFRVMYVCEVALGNVYETTKLFDEKPTEYDSVHGKASPGALNYDEYVVYDEKCAIPTHAIVYSLR
ncbi:hypothetical protein BC833DRAFT_562308 [Globomyces pollinis-pini]|nr:hypothetical protein BC833DRAFT_562308 [Globomyces pollinis-pini]